MTARFVSNSYQAPRGRIYFKASGDVGEDYLGNTPSCTFSIKTETLDHFSAESGLKTKDASWTIGIERSLKLTCDNLSFDNLARWGLADVSTISQPSDTTTDETIENVQQGHYYQLGVSAGQRTGVRSISNVIVKVGQTTKTVTTDYTVNADLGRIYIVIGGGIADDADITVTYDQAAKTWTQAKASSAINLAGSLHFIADSQVGENRDWYFPSVNLQPDGEISLKETDPKLSVMSFNVSVLDPSAADPNDTRKAFYIDGRPST